MAITYTFTGQGFWNVPGNWDAFGIPPNPLPNGDAIIISKTGGDQCWLTTNLTFAQGSTFTVNLNVDLIVGAFDLTNSGTINIYGMINSDPGFVFTNNSTGLIATNSAVFVNGILNNAGNIQINDGSWFLGGNGHINTGTIELNGNSNLNIDGGGFDNSGLLKINSSASITNGGTFTNNLTVQVDGTFGNGDFFYPGIFINNLTLKGTGTFRHEDGTFTNNTTGIIAPGASPGRLTVEGDVSLGSGTYHCEINGTGQGTTYDWLAINGRATIGGSSKLNIVFGYNPTVGATFNILTASPVSGTFSFPANVSFSGGGVQSISLSYPGGNTVRVTVESLLPVELISFTAKEQQNKVLLDWSTASEQNNRGFEVQRSGDGTNWETLDFLTGNGTATDAHHYVYLDEKPLPKVNYYRLRQMDFDDKFEFSPIRSVEIKGNGPGDWKVYPNPSHGSFFVETLGEEGVVTLIAPDGKQLLSTVISNENKTTTIATADLPPGLYWLRLRTATGLFTKKIMIE